jgi:hypothetical protein
MQKGAKAAGAVFKATRINHEMVHSHGSEALRALAFLVLTKIFDGEARCVSRHHNGVWIGKMNYYQGDIGPETGQSDDETGKYGVDEPETGQSDETGKSETESETVAETESGAVAETGEMHLHCDRATFTTGTNPTDWLDTKAINYKARVPSPKSEILLRGEGYRGLISLGDTAGQQTGSLWFGLPANPKTSAANELVGPRMWAGCSDGPPCAFEVERKHGHLFLADRLDKLSSG